MFKMNDDPILLSFAVTNDVSQETYGWGVEFS